MSTVAPLKVKLSFTWIVVLTLLLTYWPASQTTYAAAIDTPLDLAGVVKNKSGQVVANASIFIYTAGPRMGTGYL